MTTSVFIREKSNRLLVSGAVVISCGERGIEAVVHGDHDTYHVFPEGQEWSCTCAAWTKSCSHALAVEKVARP